MKSGPQRRYGPNQLLPVMQIATTDQCTLHLHVLQNPQQDGITPILFVHALALDGNMWQGVADVLASYNPPFLGGMYAIDCRGHGKSDATDEIFTTKQFANDLLAALKGIGVTQAHIVGCSMGGTVALAFAGHYPESTGSITIIDATAWYGPEAQSNWESRGQAALTKGMASLIEFQRARWFSPEFLEKQPVFVQEAINVFIANDVEHYANSCRMLGQADEREILKNYHGPAMVIVGEDDFATPLAMSQDVAGRIAGAKLTVIPQTRHFTPLEAPEQVAKCISKIISIAQSSNSLAQ